MVAEDWVTVKIPRLMALDIDAFIKSDLAKKNGVFSRGDLVVDACGKILAQAEKEYGLFRNRKGRGNSTSEPPPGEN